MYIESWVFWIIVIAIVGLIGEIMSLIIRLGKTSHMFDDFTRASNNIALRLTKLFDCKTKEEKIDTIVHAFLDGADQSVSIPGNYLDTADILSMFKLFSSFEPREPITPLSYADGESEKKYKEIEEAVRKDVEDWIEERRFVDWKPE